MVDAFQRIKVAAILGAGSLFLLAANLSSAAQPEAEEKGGPSKEYAEEYHPALKDQAKPSSDLILYGPEANECVKFEPAGLRITVPLGYPKQRPGTGVVTDFGVKGDFEITVAFEILLEKTADPPKSYATLRLMIVPNEPAQPGVWHKASQNRAAIAREVISPRGGGRYFASSARWNPDISKDQWGNEIFDKIETPTDKRIPAKSLKGRLRLVRRGEELFYYAADDDEKDFRLAHKTTFGTKDLKNVRVLATTGVPGDALDALVTDLHIRADGFVKGAPPVPPRPTEEPRSLAVPIAVGSGILVLLVLLLTVGAWLFLRNSRARTPPHAAGSAGTLVFACSQCGKKIKTKSDRAGKTLKCPHCGGAVQAPDDAEDR